MQNDPTGHQSRNDCGNHDPDDRIAFVGCHLLSESADGTLPIHADLMTLARSVQNGSASVNRTFLPVDISIIFPLGFRMTACGNDETVLVGNLLLPLVSQLIYGHATQ